MTAIAHTLDAEARAEYYADMAELRAQADAAADENRRIAAEGTDAEVRALRTPEAVVEWQQALRPADSRAAIRRELDDALEVSKLRLLLTRSGALDGIA